MKRFVIVMAGSLLLATPALAEELPWSAANTVSASRAVMLAAGDLDSDGDIDLVSIDDQGNAVNVHLNDSDGTTWTTNSFYVQSVDGLAIGDSDNDGHLDLATSATAAGLTDVWLNDGTGTAWTQSSLTNGAYSGGDVVFVDLDNNGGLDVVSSGQGVLWIRGHTNAGVPQGAGAITAGGANGSSVFGGDFDQDGVNDLLDIYGDNIELWTNTNTDLGTGTLNGVGTGVILDGAHDGELADLDGDGDLDVVVSAQDGTGAALVWFKNNAGVLSGTALTILASAGGADRISTTDLDRDGDIDVLLSAGTDGAVLFLENTGDGATWTTRTVNGSMTGATHAIGADVDGDGDLDVVAAGTGSVVWHENQRLHTTVTFGTEVPITTGLGSGQRIGFGDLDMDGDLDLIGGDSSYCTGNNCGGPHWVQNLSDGALWGTATSLASFLTNFRQGLAFDIDQDGDLDPVAVTNNSSPYIQYFENDRSGTFGAGITVPGSGSATALISVGDVDNDGDVDIVRGVNSGGEVYWMRNNGGGSWSSCPIADFDTSNDTVLGDMDGDGDLDVIVQDNESPAGSQLLINNGTCGAWSTQATIQVAAPSGLGNLDVGDIDGDGDLDLITASTSDGLTWYENPGSPALLAGSWVAALIDASPPGRSGIKVADLDLDGDLDVLAGGGGTAVWYENTGDFATPWTSQTLNVSAGDGDYVIPVDLDQDGALDVAWSGGGGHGWAPMLHQQASAVGASVAMTCVYGSDCIEESDAAAVLTIDLAHLGRAVDVDIELGTVDLLLESASSPMSDANAASAFTEVSIWSDGTGSVAGALDAGDTKLVGVTSFTLTAGLLSIPIPSTADSAVLALGSGTFFVVVEASGTAVSDGITDIDVTWQPTTGATIHYAGTDFAVGLDGGPASATGGFTIGGLDSDDDADPDTSDCNDSDATVYSGAAETCNGVDDDCDNSTDEDFDTDGDFYFTDADAGCVATYAASSLLDCVDTDATINPGITEVCDGVDEDCDTAIDNGFDGDADGYFTSADAGCVSEYGAAADCDDAVASTSPAGTEVCDGVDQDCDGVIDQTFDIDGDLAYAASDAGCVTTYGVAVDCDDAVATTNPSAAETCNQVDDDCDTVVDDGFDVDGDTFFTVADAGCVATYGASADCDDADGTQFPGATEVCNRADDDCDGTVPADETDNDGDTYVECEAAADCDDADASQFPGATEVCNAEDDNCDGIIDDGFDGDGDGAFTDAVAACVTTYGAAADCNDAVASINPTSAEICDAVDQDCDGTVDDGFDVDGDGVTTCGPDGLPGATADNDCDDTDDTTNPTLPELCDAVDNDCDGAVDDGLDTDGDGITPCGVNGVIDGLGATTDDDCDDTNSAILPGATEICDFIDSDCDGSIVDEDPDFDSDLVPDCVDTDDDGDGDPDSSDCNDFDDAIYTGAFESCDSVDSDCNGSIVDTDTDTDSDLVPDCVDDDDDGDGITDVWEDQNGYDALDASDATLDDDGDGRDTLQEFTDDTDPSSYDGPDAPALVSPEDGVNVTTGQPELVIDNATSPLGDTLTYSFEVYGDEALTDLVTSDTGVLEGINGSSWTVDLSLDEDTRYWWRAAASDAYVMGEWTDPDSFFIDVDGDAPSVPVPVAPLTGEVMAADAQELVWFDSVSPQGQELLYVVTVLDAAGADTVVDAEVSGTPGLETETLDISEVLTAGDYYRWTVEAFDESGRASGPSEEQYFGFLTTNTPPGPPSFVSPVDDASIEEVSPLVTLGPAFDEQGGELLYLLEIDDTIEFSSAFDPSQTAPEDATSVVFDLDDEGIVLTEGEWFLRARARDLNGATSDSVQISIFVRGDNDPPTVPRLDAPTPDLVTDPTATGFTVSDSEDPEGDAITYELVVTSDRALTDVLLQRSVDADGDGLGVFPPEAVEVRGRLWWSARAVDDRGAASDWSAPRRVVVFDESWGGCTAVASDRTPSGWLLLLVLLGLTRRRSRCA